MFDGENCPFEYPAIEHIRQYVLEKQESVGTFHEYETSGTEHTKLAIKILKYGTIYRSLIQKYPDHNISAITGMNEIYVSSIGSDGSDKVFETPHIDGIFYFLPWCRIYRCILAIQGNKNVVTVFPSTQTEKILQNGEFVGFDYNRDIHYIRQIAPVCSVPGTKRIILKLHYIVVPFRTPQWLIGFYMLLNTKYNDFMRYLFLKSQGRNKSLVLSWIINTGTQLYTKWVSTFSR